MTRQQRARHRPTLVAERLDALLSEMGWGSRERVLARLHLLAQRHPRFASLATLKANQLSILRKGQRWCTDVELIALAVACRVSVGWLCGLTDQKDPEPYVLQLDIEE